MEKQIQEIILEKMRFGLQQIMSPALLEELKFEQYLDDQIGYMVQQVKGWVWSRTVHEHSSTECIGTIKYPANWWEAFKERWFPQWWKKRWAVKFNIHEVLLKNHVQLIKTCPHLNIAQEGVDMHLRFLGEDWSHEHEGA